MKYVTSFSVRFKKPEMERIWAVARAQGSTRTDVVKKAIMSHIEECEKRTLGVNQNENG